MGQLPSGQLTSGQLPSGQFPSRGQLSSGLLSPWKIVHTSIPTDSSITVKLHMAKTAPKVSVTIAVGNSLFARWQTVWSSVCPVPVGAYIKPKHLTRATWDQADTELLGGPGFMTLQLHWTGKD